MSLLAIRDSLRVNFLEYTRTAFKILPPVENPSILDIGCGSGVQTIELAKMCNGPITAIDIDVEALEAFRRKIEELGFSSRISIMRLSMLELNNLRETYNIVWAEGSIFVVGFETGIRDWKQLLAKNGFLVVHDEDTDVLSKLQIIAKYRYEVLGQIEVPHDEWWNRYYKPLESILIQGKIDEEKVEEIRREISTFKKNRMGSTFFILQNKP